MKGTTLKIQKSGPKMLAMCRVEFTGEPKAEAKDEEPSESKA